MGTCEVTRAYSIAPDCGSSYAVYHVSVVHFCVPGLNDLKRAHLCVRLIKIIICDV